MDPQDKKAFDALDDLQPYVAAEYGNALEVAMQAIETLAKVRELLADLETESAGVKTYCEPSRRELQELRALVSP